jgi:hypothetical protein
MGSSRTRAFRFELLSETLRSEHLLRAVDVSLLDRTHEGPRPALEPLIERDDHAR